MTNILHTTVMKIKMVYSGGGQEGGSAEEKGWEAGGEGAGRRILKVAGTGRK